MTKEDLLELGLDENTATAVLAKADTSVDEQLDPVTALEKALNPVEMQDLFKAGDPDEGDEDEDDDGSEEKDMKKNMKKYMKENPGMCKKMMKEAGLFKEKMSKAADELDLEGNEEIINVGDVSGLVSEFVGTSEVVAELSKAVTSLSNQVQTISAQNEKLFNLASASGMVQVEMAKASSLLLSKPTGRKGSVGSAAVAQQKQAIPAQAGKVIHETLTKAMKAGDREAGILVSALESKGLDVNALNPSQQNAIGQKLKEAK